MNLLLKFFFNFWAFICAVSVIVSVASVFIGYHRSKSKSAAVSALQTISVSILLTLASFSAIIGNCFTKVPDLVNKNSVGEANGILHQAGLQLVLMQNQSFDGNLEKMIISQSIEAGTLVPKDTTISIDYERHNKSDETIVCVPQLQGMEQMEAVELLTGLDLQFQVWWTEENNISAENYYVIKQSIEAGVDVKTGTLVKLELSPYEPK